MLSSDFLISHLTGGKVLCRLNILDLRSVNILEPLVFLLEMDIPQQLLLLHSGNQLPIYQTIKSLSIGIVFLQGLLIGLNC